MCQASFSPVYELKYADAPALPDQHPAITGIATVDNSIRALLPATVAAIRVKKASLIVRGFLFSIASSRRIRNICLLDNKWKIN